MFQFKFHRPAHREFLVFVFISGCFSVPFTACRSVPSSDAVAAVNNQSRCVSAQAEQRFLNHWLTQRCIPEMARE
jgi:hypothetical protein